MSDERAPRNKRPLDWVDFAILGISIGGAFALSIVGWLWVIYR